MQSTEALRALCHPAALRCTGRRLVPSWAAAGERYRQPDWNMLDAEGNCGDESIGGRLDDRAGVGMCGNPDWTRIIGVESGRSDAFDNHVY
jgi:hypothetical protein